MSIQAVTTRDIRDNFKKYADDVTNYNDIVLVARPKGENLVIMSEKEFQSIQETNYLLSSPANREVLLNGIKAKSYSKKFSPEEWEEFIKDE